MKVALIATSVTALAPVLVLIWSVVVVDVVAFEMPAHRDPLVGGALCMHSALACVSQRACRRCQ